MAELTTLARPYAKAAFEFAKGHNALDRWSNMLTTVTQVVSQPTVQKLLASPSITAEQKAKSIIDICGDDVDNKVGNFISYLADNNRLTLLPQVQELFELYKANAEQSVDVELTTAFALSGEQEAKLADALKSKLDRKVTMTSTVDQSLIGGVVVRAGDLVIDGSVKGRIAKLTDSLSI